MLYQYYAFKGRWRPVVLFHRSYGSGSWILVHSKSTLKKADELRHLKPIDYKPKPVANKLEAKRKSYRKLGLGFPKRALQQAIEVRAVRDYSALRPIIAR